jgi:hypothetical protein
MKTWEIIALALEGLQAMLAALDFFNVGPPGMSAEALWRFLYIAVTLFTWGFIYCNSRLHADRKQANYRLLGSIALFAVIVGGVGYSASRGDRHLTQEQKAALVKSLREGKELRAVEIWTLEYPTTEAGRYAQDFIEIFVEAGWTVRKEIIKGNLAPAHPSFYFRIGDPVATPLAVQLEAVDSRIHTEGVAYSDPIRFTIRPRPPQD